VINVKASPKLFSYAEVTNLTGICAEHLENLAKRHRLGFIARAKETQGNRADQWFFRPWDLMVLATLSPAVRTKVGDHFTEWRRGTNFFSRSLCAATLENSARDQAL
jgi:hypothetical protein